MGTDWVAAGGAILGALVAIAAIRHWRNHTRRRSIHFEFDWSSETRDDLEKGQKKGPPEPTEVDPEGL